MFCIFRDFMLSMGSLFVLGSLIDYRNNQKPEIVYQDIIYEPEPIFLIKRRGEAEPI